MKENEQHRVQLSSRGCILSDEECSCDASESSWCPHRFAALELTNEQPQPATTEKSEGFFCAKLNDSQETDCKEQCKNCADWGVTVKEKSEEERIREIIYPISTAAHFRVTRHSYKDLEVDRAAKAIKEYYHTDIIEPLKKRIAKLISIFVQQRSRIKELMDEQKGYETRIKVLLEQIKVRDEEIEPLKKKVDQLAGKGLDALINSGDSLILATERQIEIEKLQTRIQELEKELANDKKG